MSAFARAQVGEVDTARADETLIRWLQREEQLFRAIERTSVEERIKEGFAGVDDFVAFSLSVQNRRKSRMGYSLQNQLGALFDAHKLKYEPQAQATQFNSLSRMRFTRRTPSDNSSSCGRCRPLLLL
jgi:hypothetical protein